MESPSSTSAAADPARFRTTHWSAVLAAAQSPGPQAAAALESLCGAYWQPVYAHVRRQGHGVEAARDLTQEFFARLLEGQWLRPADPQRGRFRSFLLRCLSRFLIDEWRHGAALKRGGGREFFSLDEARGEEQWALEPAAASTPELSYDRRWAEALIARANARLRATYEADGQGKRFQTLKWPRLKSSVRSAARPSKPRRRRDFARAASCAGSSAAATSPRRGRATRAKAGPTRWAGWAITSCWNALPKAAWESFTKPGSFR